MKNPPSLPEVSPRVSLGRRRLAAGVAIAPAIVAAPAMLALPGLAKAQAALPLTPECRPRAAATPAQTEGPFYSANTPERRSLRDAGIKGTPIVLGGLVLRPDCRPVAGALIDFWQADAEGAYDNRGFRLRGHQFTDAEGRYRLETILPGLYPGRTRHIHVKVRAPQGRVLTTQLYFPGEAANARDGIYRPELLVKGAPGDARFDFVVDA